MCPRLDGRIRLVFKRTLDIVLASLGLVLLALPMLLIALVVRSYMGRPVLFQQTRAGLRGKPFTIYKFRTMSVEGDVGLDDEVRLTKIGRFLRATSLDEVPELLNVLKGDMSIVGPRPLLMEYLCRYNQHQARRHEVKPGMTGWAQVNGRNALSWEEKFRLDVWYVDNWNLLLDLRIMWMTFPEVLRRKGVSAVGHSTMPKFRGDRR